MAEEDQVVALAVVAEVMVEVEVEEVEVVECHLTHTWHVGCTCINKCQVHPLAAGRHSSNNEVEVVA